MPEVMRVLGEIVEVQERIKDRERALNGLPPETLTSVLPSERSSKVYVPLRLRNLVNKEVNFGLFVSLLMDKID